MRVYLGFDDTDVAGHPVGTGRLVRMFARNLPEGCEIWGVVRHQLPRLPGIPFTSNNSSACLVLDVDGVGLDELEGLAVEHILRNVPEGSDPGLCLAPEFEVADGLVDFALRATGRKTDQKEALRAAGGIRLQGLGGSNDGIIGAAAAVGLTKYGWCGRFIEFGGLRSLEQPLTIADLRMAGVRVVSVDRDPLVPLPEDALASEGWIRPSLWASQPVLQVVSDGECRWRTAHSKRGKRQGQKGRSALNAPPAAPLPQ